MNQFGIEMIRRRQGWLRCSASCARSPLRGERLQLPCADRSQRDFVAGENAVEDDHYRDDNQFDRPHAILPLLADSRPPPACAHFASVQTSTRESQVENRESCTMLVDLGVVLAELNHAECNKASTQGGSVSHGERHDAGPFIAQRSKGVVPQQSPGCIERSGSYAVMTLDWGRFSAGPHVMVGR